MKPKILATLLFCIGSIALAIETRTIPAQALIDKPQIDGRLDEEFYRSVTPSSGFQQFHPVNGAVASLETQIWVVYTSRSLVIGFRCSDPEPQRIRADITPFGGYENNDEVTVLLDPFADRRNYISFSVNARGVRSGQDTIWSAAAIIDKQGWSGEVEIPFKSLRFPVRDTQAWGLNFRRYSFRLNETDYWAPVTREQEGILASTFGRLTGLAGIRGGKNLEIFPYAGFRSSQSPDLKENRLAYGLDLKYGITSNLTLDLSAAPDYSEVESDPFFYQTDPYEYKLSERRPFFTEGQDYFSTSYSLFYSRRITDPTLALKATGKEKGYSLGTMFAVNDTPAGDSFYGVLRLKKDILKLSWIGLVYSAVEGAGNWNRNLGFDFQFRFSQVYTLSGFAARTFNEQGSRGKNGIYRIVFGKRQTRGFTFAAVFDRIEPDVSAPAGYIPHTDLQKIWLLPRYDFLWEGKIVERLQLTASLTRFNAVSSGELTSDGGEIIASIYFRNQIRASATFLIARERHRVLDGDGALAWNRELFPFRGPTGSFSFLGHRWFQAGLNAYYLDAAVYSDDFRRVLPGKIANLSGWMAVKLSPSWSWEWSLGYDRRHSASREVDFRGLLLSTTIRWQIARSLSTFAKFQYDSAAERFGYDFLLQYEPAPVSRMVLSLKNYCEERFRLFHPEARTLALKLSYLFRI